MEEVKKKKRKYIKSPMTEWGIRVTGFRLRYGMTLTDLCKKVDVPQSTVSAVMVGRTRGDDAVEKIEAYMAEIVATVPPPTPLPFSQPCA